MDQRRRELELEALELANRERELLIERGWTEEKLRRLELVARASELVREGVLQADPVEIFINDYPFLAVREGRVDAGESMKRIAEGEVVGPEDRTAIDGAEDAI